MKVLRSYGLYLAWVVALTGTLVSLYFGEVLNFTPCRLCWFQRVALFPLALILGIAAYRIDEKVKIYAYPLCFFGFAVALLQILLPYLPLPHLCGVGPDCHQGMIYFFGLVPFPWISAFGFFMIAMLLRLSGSGESISR